MVLAKINDSVWNINRLATFGDTEDHITTPFVFLDNVPLKVNSVELKYTLRDIMIELMLNGHLVDSKLLIKSKHSSIGILVYKDTTS